MDSGELDVPDDSLDQSVDHRAGRSGLLNISPRDDHRRSILDKPFNPLTQCFGDPRQLQGGHPPATRFDLGEAGAVDGHGSGQFGLGQASAASRFSDPPADGRGVD